MTRFTNPLTMVSLVAVLLLAGASRSGAAASPADEMRKARELVRQLGDIDFEAREQASKRLLALGVAVKDVLLEGSRSSDLEIRRRCLDLLPAVLEADRKARLEAFIADKGGKKEHDLPGWKRFRKIAGTDTAARDLFIAIQRSEGAAFLEDVERKPKQAADLLAGRSQEVWQSIYGMRIGGRAHTLTLAEVAPLYLAGSDPALVGTSTAGNQMLNYLWQPQPQAALRGGASPFKNLVLAWMAVQTDDNVVQQMFNVINSISMKEGLPLALKLAKAKKIRGMALATALTTIGRLGTKEHVKELEAYLTDKATVFNFNFAGETGATQVRDVALAMAVHLSGQDHKNYNFFFARKNNPWMKFQPYYLGFTSETDRTKALKKWKDLSDAGKKKK